MNIVFDLKLRNTKVIATSVSLPVHAHINNQFYIVTVRYFLQS
jgi:hypothetical protein